MVVWFEGVDTCGKSTQIEKNQAAQSLEGRLEN
jgi:thymidylate kinase